MAGVVILLVFVAGYAVQRGSICAVAAAAELIERRPQRFLAFLLCAAIALAVMAAGALLGEDRFAFYRGSGAGAMPLLGGAIFGAGAWLNGRCAFGTVARLGSGELARLGTVAGFLAGFALAAGIGLAAPPAEVDSLLVGAPPLAVFIVAVATAAALLWFTVKRSPPEAGWSPLVAMAVIGLANGALLVLAAGWPYTNLLMDLATSTGMDLAWRSALAATFVTGAVAGALFGGGFVPAFGPLALWLRCLAGGALMGVGATLVPGGNDTMLLVGLPLLLPSFAVAYAAMFVVLVALAQFGVRSRSPTSRKV